MAAGSQMPPQFIRYWSKGGAGGARIDWGHDGDYSRCMTEIQAEVSKHGKPLPDRMIHGACATLHKLNTGATPGHAPGESKPGSDKGNGGHKG